jgi:hypothetical protein
VDECEPLVWGAAHGGDREVRRGEGGGRQGGGGDGAAGQAEQQGGVEDVSTRAGAVPREVLSAESTRVMPGIPGFSGVWWRQRGGRRGGIGG